MCGIVYVRRKDNKPAARAVLKRYREQRGRGTQGFGYVAIQDNRVVSYQRAPTEHEITKKLEKETASEVIFHHRFPTSTPNLEEQAHPMLIRDKNLKYQYFVIHNGVIRNTDMRYEAHEREGFVYSTKMELLYRMGKKIYETGFKWNDSESLAIDTALFLEDKSSFINSSGTAAVIVLQMEGKRVINRFFFRNSGNPLNFWEDNNMQTWTSAGKGKELDPLSLYHLTDKGVFERDAKILRGPYSWQDNQHQHRNEPWKKDQRTTVHDFVRARGHLDMDDLSQLGRDLDDVVQNPMGFLTDGRSSGGRFRDDEDPSQDLIDEVFEDVDMTPDDGAPMHISDIEFVPEKSFTFVMKMTEAELWDEWYRVEEAAANLTKFIGKMEDKIVDFDHIDAETIRVRNEIQSKLDSLKRYLVIINNRLQDAELKPALPYGVS